MSLSEFLDRHPDTVEVRLTRVRGSAPREEGAGMIVSATACHGTIGGGQLEYMMIDAARAMLAQGHTRRDLDIPLGPEIGQCCGGRVAVTLRLMDITARRAARAGAEAEAQARPHVYVMGAGHVGRALAQLLVQMPVRTVVVDSRRAELALCPEEADRRESALPETEINRAPPGSAFVILTHDHALDFLLSAEALARGDAAYVGMIGSATKRARLATWCRNHCDGLRIDALTCPIGAATGGDKRPEVIAAGVLAEVMAALARHAAMQSRALHVSG
ncbi:MAG TPA: xanthine dehydrogenase accessory protein XdhC [Roseovarius sp.]|nr:xanthine dehydrogenase accessory protein XdhC [Roseovarius sp.]